MQPDKRGVSAGKCLSRKGIGRRGRGKNRRKRIGEKSGKVGRNPKERKEDEGHEPFHRLGIIVGKEQAFPAVQRFDGSHILCAQREIKKIKVLLHAILVN